MHSAAPPLRLYRGDLLAAAFALFLAALLGGLTLLDVYGDRIMKRCVTVAALVAVALVLTACGSMGQFLTQPTIGRNGQPSTLGTDALQHIEMCYRDYNGALGAGLTGGVHIVCLPVIPEGSKIVPLSQLGMSAAATGAVVLPATPQPAATPEAAAPR